MTDDELQEVVDECSDGKGSITEEMFVDVSRTHPSHHPRTLPVALPIAPT